MKVVKTTPQDEGYTPEVPDLSDAPTPRKVEYMSGPRRGGRKGGNPEDKPGFRLGEFLRLVIHQKGLTREQAAERCNLTTNGLNHIVQGNVVLPNGETITDLAKGLGVTPLDIFAHTPLVSERDIQSFVHDQLRGGTMAEDPTWALISNALSRMPQERRDATLAAFWAILGAMQRIAPTDLAS